MQGQTATNRSAELRFSRVANAPTTPAMNAAQKGGSRTFSLGNAGTRRTTAPAAALPTINATADTWRTPKMTDSAAAPVAAASVKSQVEAGGIREMERSRLTAADAVRSPDATESIRRITADTRPMWIPTGSASTTV